MSKVAIMQPYFLPYIGYWQLMNAVDEFVVYDNIEYTKKGWFNRNRILDKDHDRLFTIPLKKDSDYLNVNQRQLSDDSTNDINRQLRVIKSLYQKAPHFNEAYPIIEKCFLFTDRNLFDYILNSIKQICDYLNIQTKLIVSSTVDIDHSLKSEKKVMAICKQLNADTYVNATGGQELYEKENFKANTIDLKFIKTNAIEYRQFENEFVPSLSIIDIMMFNDKASIAKMLDEYELI